MWGDSSFRAYLDHPKMSLDLLVFFSGHDSSTVGVQVERMT